MITLHHLEESEKKVHQMALGIAEGIVRISPEEYELVDKTTRRAEESQLEEKAAEQP